MTKWGEPSWAAVPLRLVAGIILVVAGYIKLTGMAGAITYFGNQGFPVPLVTAWFVALLEFVGGLALIAGFRVRFLGAIFAIQFIVAALWVKFPGVGYTAARIDLLLIASATALFFLGAGPWSIDARLQRTQR